MPLRPSTRINARRPKPGWKSPHIGGPASRGVGKRSHTRAFSVRTNRPRAAPLHPAARSRVFWRVASVAHGHACLLWGIVHRSMTVLCYHGYRKPARQMQASVSNKYYYTVTPSLYPMSDHPHPGGFGTFTGQDGYQKGSLPADMVESLYPARFTSS